jgi:hypothetical protein
VYVGRCHGMRAPLDMVDARLRRQCDQSTHPRLGTSSAADGARGVRTRRGESGGCVLDIVSGLCSGNCGQNQISAEGRLGSPRADSYSSAFAMWGDTPSNAGNLLHGVL